MTTALAATPSKTAAQRKKPAPAAPASAHDAAISSLASPPGQSAFSSSSRSSSWC